MRKESSGCVVEQRLLVWRATGCKGTAKVFRWREAKDPGRVGGEASGVVDVEGGFSWQRCLALLGLVCVMQCTDTQ